jgi:hypothetical protein
MSTAKNQAARLMGISPRALSHYLAKYPSLDAVKRPVFEATNGQD